MLQEVALRKPVGFLSVLHPHKVYDFSYFVYLRAKLLVAPVQRIPYTFRALSVHDAVFVTIRGFPPHAYRACISEGARQ